MRRASLPDAKREKEKSKVTLIPPSDPNWSGSGGSHQGVRDNVKQHGVGMTLLFPASIQMGTLDAEDERDGAHPCL